MTATRIHTVGGSGSGTSTLGEAIATALSYTWLDADDFFWEPTDPPYTTQRAKPKRIARRRAKPVQVPSPKLLKLALDRCEKQGEDPGCQALRPEPERADPAGYWLQGE